MARLYSYLIAAFLIIGLVGCVPKVPDSGASQPAPAPAASCSDGIRNQGEEDADCGGPCAACPEPEPVEEVQVYALTEEQEASLKSVIKANDKAKFLYPSYPKGIEVGESYVFALGITNTHLERKVYRVYVKFIEARDSSTNVISGTDSTMESWTGDNRFGTYSLATYEQAFVPVGVTAKEYIGAGKETVPGTYYFQAIVEYQDGSFWQDHALVDFNIRVK